MEFERPSDLERLNEVDGSVIIPNRDGEYPDELFKRLVSRKDDRGGSTDVPIPLIGAEDGHYTLDVNGFAWLIWEHRQYSQARGFSPMQMDVLRAVQQLSQNDNLVLYSDIKTLPWITYAESSISTALTNLADQGLIKRVSAGVFRFQGFDSWVPPEEA